MSTQVIVTRWVNEDGRRTRRWYWEVHYGGTTVAAGIERTEIAARHRGIEELAVAAYTAGACSQAGDAS